jgi:hypothetical protein
MGNSKWQWLSRHAAHTLHRKSKTAWCLAFLEATYSMHSSVPHMSVLRLHTVCTAQCLTCLSWGYIQCTQLSASHVCLEATYSVHSSVPHMSVLRLRTVYTAQCLTRLSWGYIQCAQLSASHVCLEATYSVHSSVPHMSVLRLRTVYTAQCLTCLSWGMRFIHSWSQNEILDIPRWNADHGPTILTVSPWFSSVLMCNCHMSGVGFLSNRPTSPFTQGLASCLTVLLHPSHRGWLPV